MPTGLGWRHQQLKTLLPHRYPMLLVDAVTELRPGESIRAIKAVTLDEAAYAGIARGTAETALGYPTSLVIESFCQAAGILFMETGAASYARERQVLLFGALMGCRVLGAARPGDLLTHHARITKTLSDSAVFGGHVQVDGRTILTLEHVVMAIRDRAVLEREAV
jgi:3-hydroxyacyl-[acyl-carrier-protein] dehydratase